MLIGVDLVTSAFVLIGVEFFTSAFGVESVTSDIVLIWVELFTSAVIKPETTFIRINDLIKS